MTQIVQPESKGRVSDGPALCLSDLCRLGKVSDLTRIFHELLAATTDMAVLPGVLGCRPLRRTVTGTPRNQSRGTAGRVARLHAHLRDLATAIHEISGLKEFYTILRTGNG